MPPPCSYRQAAFDALTTTGLAWHVSMNANSVQGVQSAVAAGLGISGKKGSDL
jgi:DNA-binding transcriptional LysR family regulator